MIGFYLEWAVSTIFGLCYQEPFGKEWDKKLSDLLDATPCDEAKLGTYTHQLGNCEVWVGNKYYSYGHLNKYFAGDIRYWRDDHIEQRPSIKTMRKLNTYVESIRETQRKEKSAHTDAIIKKMN